MATSDQHHRMGWPWRGVALLLRSLHGRGEADAILGDLLEEYGPGAAGRRPRSRLRCAGDVAAALGHGFRDRWSQSRLPRFHGVSFMLNVLSDLRFGARSLRRRPGFAIGVIVILALGIGANTAIFSVVNGILLRPLPFPEPERLVAVWYDLHGIGFSRTDWPDPAIFRDWEEQSELVEGLAALGGITPTLTGDGAPEQLVGAAVSRDTFAVLGVAPVLGRSFAAEEDVPDGPAVAVIADSLWKRRFGADPNIIGKTVELDRQPSTIVGVLPEGFRFVHMNSDMVEATEIFLPFQLDPSACGYGCYTLRVVARLRPGATLEAAEQELTAILHRAASDFPIADQIRAVVVPLRTQMVGTMRMAVLLLLGAVGLVLLIACANVANLLLARAAGRDTEIAIRTALGAGRTRLIRQFVTESVLLAGIGGAAGLILAYGGVRGLVALLSTGVPVPRLAEVGVDPIVLAFALVISGLTGLLFGLAPAMYALKPNVTASLKDGGRGTAGSASGRRLRNSLVIAEVALAMTLLVVSALLVRGFATLVGRDPGFRSDGVLTVSLTLPPTEYEREQRVGFFEDLTDRVLAIPGVQSAAAISTLPLSGNNGDSGFAIEGRPAPEPGQNSSAWIRRITPGYFDTMGIPLLEGRRFVHADRGGEPRVIIINAAMRESHWPDESPLGAVMNFGSVSMEVVGVVGDVKNFGLDSDERPAGYIAHAQNPVGFMTLVVRAGDPLQVAPPTRAAVHELDPNLAVSAMSTMGDIVSGSVAPQRATTLLLGLFSMLAMLLAAVGLYGVMHYTVAQRVPEIGVRMALGADSRGVERLVVGHGMKLALTGLAIGLVAAVAVSRFLDNLLYGISPTDVVSFVSVPALLGAVALAASWLPARRASRVDPLEALRCE